MYLYVKLDLQFSSHAIKAQLTTPYQIFINILCARFGTTYIITLLQLNIAVVCIKINFQ